MQETTAKGKFEYTQIIRIISTRTWTWREPRWWPIASCGKSWGVRLFRKGGLSQLPGTGGTAKHMYIRIKIKLYLFNQISKSPSSSP